MAVFAQDNANSAGFFWRFLKVSWPYSFIQSGIQESPQALDMFSFSSVLECELRWRSQPAQGFRSISPFYPVATAPPFIRYREECSWNKPCPFPFCNLRKPLTVGRLKPEMSKQAWGFLLISEPPCTYFTPSFFSSFSFFLASPLSCFCGLCSL